MSLDTILAGPGLTIVPGAHDALSARLAAQAGARAVYLSGFGVAGSAFALPDIGLVGPWQMTERVGALADAAAPVPLIADGDNGHGGPLQVAKLVRAYARAGAAAIQLEDQVLPKRCGHMEGKDVIALGEAAAKIRAAADARQGTPLKIIARTDARATHDLDEALRRGDAFLEAGADALFIEAPRDEAEMRRIADAFHGAALIANLVEDGKTPWLTPASLESLGYRIALYPISGLLAAAAMLQRTYGRLLAGQGDAPAGRLSFPQYNAAMGLPEFLAAAERYRPRTKW